MNMPRKTAETIRSGALINSTSTSRARGNLHLYTKSRIALVFVGLKVTLEMSKPSGSSTPIHCVAIEMTLIELFLAIRLNESEKSCEEGPVKSVIKMHRTDV